METPVVAAAHDFGPDIAAAFGIGGMLIVRSVRARRTQETHRVGHRPTDSPREAENGKWAEAHSDTQGGLDGGRGRIEHDVDDGSGEATGKYNTENSSRSHDDDATSIAIAAVSCKSVLPLAPFFVFDFVRPHRSICEKWQPLQPP